MKQIIGKKLFFLSLFFVLLSPFTSKALTTGDITDAAKRRADYITYDFHYGNAPINPAINDSARLVSCDRFVGWVVYDLGWTDQPEIQGLVVYDSRGINDLSQYLESHGFTKITDHSEIQEGDIMFHNMYGETNNSRHTYIVGPKGPNGDFTRFDAGSEERLQLIDQYYPYREKGGQPFYEGVPADSWSYGYRFPDVVPGEGSGSGGDGKLTDDFANGFPSLLTANNYDCKYILYDAYGSETEFKKILDGVFTLMQILAPIIAIALTIIDYIKSISSGNISTSKVNVRMLIRIAIAIIIIFLPYIVDILFHAFGIYDLQRCHIGG